MTNQSVADLFLVFSAFCKTGQLITVKAAVYFGRAPARLVAEIVYSV
jgi:hypothetical protein